MYTWPGARLTKKAEEELQRQLEKQRQKNVRRGTAKGASLGACELLRRVGLANVVVCNENLSLLLLAFSLLEVCK